MNVNMPFLDFVAVVPLRDRMPDEVCTGEKPAESGTGGSWGMFCASSESEYGSLETLGKPAGSDRRLRDKDPCVGKMSSRAAVFAREGRGGGTVPVIVGLLAAKGSTSVFFEALCLRTGGGLCREFRTLGELD